MKLLAGLVYIYRSRSVSQLVYEGRVPFMMRFCGQHNLGMVTSVQCLSLWRPKLRTLLTDAGVVPIYVVVLWVLLACLWCPSTMLSDEYDPVKDHLDTREEV